METGDLRPAAAYRALQFALAQRALHCNRQIGMDRPGAGVHIQIESVCRTDRQAHGARSGMQLPAPGHVAVGADVAAAGARAQSTLDAAQADSAGTALDIHIARASKCSFNIAASGVAVKRGSNVLRPNPAASGLDMHAAAEIAQTDITRASLCLHLAAERPRCRYRRNRCAPARQRPPGRSPRS